MGWLSSLLSAFSTRTPARIDPDAFTSSMAERFRAALPGADVEIATRLTLTIQSAEGEQQVFLGNLYASIVDDDDPMRQGEAVEAWLASVLDVDASRSGGEDDVVPVLKSADWFDSVPKREDGTRPAHRTEALNRHIAVVYAVDTPHHVSFVESSWFEARGIASEGLRRRSVDNLRGKLPRLEVQRGGGLNMVVAGGFYESSVLLFDDFWAREAGRLRGDPVIAVPARDVLVFADGNDVRAIASLREHAVGIHADAAYALSPHLFFRRPDGRVDPYDD